MTDTLWADISEFQNDSNNTYPFSILELRSNDGTYLDRHFDANIGWARGAYKAGKLWAYIVYYFYRPGANGAQTLINRVGGTAGKSDPHLIAMIDVEGDGGKVTGNQSGQINTEFHTLAKWLGDPRRVIGYGNVGDLNGLWPQKPPGIRLIVADYSHNPAYPGKFAHQFSDTHVTNPFGPCDINSADGMTTAALGSMWGLTAPPITVPAPTQMAGTSSGPVKLGGGFVWTADGTGTLRAIAARRNARVLDLLRVSAENLTSADYAALDSYVVGPGVNLPMTKGLKFCTLHA